MSTPYSIAITKYVLKQLNAVAGCLDTDSDMVFLGFVGSLDLADNRYRGELRFGQPGDEPPDATTSIKSILSPTKPSLPNAPDPATQPQTGGASSKGRAAEVAGPQSIQPNPKS